MMDALSIALSGLTAQKQRVAASASNIANASTGGSVPSADPSAPASTVYRPLRVDFSTLEGGGVQADVTADANGYSVVYDPASPFANAQGLTAAPNVDLVAESVNLLESKSLFKANLSVIKTQEEMLGELLDTLT